MAFISDVGSQPVFSWNERNVAPVSSCFDREKQNFCENPWRPHEAQVPPQVRHVLIIENHADLIECLDLRPNVIDLRIQSSASFGRDGRF